MNKKDAFELIQRKICKIEKANLIFFEEMLKNSTPEERLLLAIFGEDKASKKSFSYEQYKKYLSNNHIVNVLRNKLKMIACGRYDESLPKVTTEKELHDLVGGYTMLKVFDKTCDDIEDEYRMLLETKEVVLERLNNKMTRVYKMQKQNAPKLIVENEIRILNEASEDMQMIQNLLDFFELRFKDYLKKNQLKS